MFSKFAIYQLEFKLFGYTQVNGQIVLFGPQIVPYNYNHFGSEYS